MIFRIRNARSKIETKRGLTSELLQKGDKLYLLNILKCFNNKRTASR